MKTKALARVCALLLLAPGLSGCAASIVGGFTVSQLSMALGLVSSATTGKGLDDQVLSLLTGRDCNLMESLFNKNRMICEPRGSVATRDDFKGFFVAYGGDKSDPLDRYARARQQELADEQIASQPVEVKLAEAISFSHPIRDGIPKTGEPVGRARLNGVVVYTMPAIYEFADLHPESLARTAAFRVRPRMRPRAKPDLPSRVVAGETGS